MHHSIKTPWFIFQVGNRKRLRRPEVLNELREIGPVVQIAGIATLAELNGYHTAKIEHESARIPFNSTEMSDLILRPLESCAVICRQERT
jgi:hypothetical protein